MQKYILVGKTPRKADLLEWARWFESHNRQVFETTLPDDVRVSTVFLGIDHSFSGGGYPLLFETMIFGGPHNNFQDRYSTWGEAELGHESAVELAKLKPIILDKL